MVVTASCFQKLDVALFPLAFGNIRENPMHLSQAFAARDTFPARFLGEKVKKVPGDIDHAGIFIHDDQAARTHHRAGLGEFVEVDFAVSSMFSGMHPPEGPPVCTALNFLPSGMPPPIL